MHGLNEGHIAPYTDIEFSTDKIPNIHYNEIPRQIITTDIRRDYYTIDKDKTCKTDGIKTIFHNRIQSRLYNKKAESKHNLAMHLHS